MDQLTLNAPAKINWSLDICGRRADGYHLLSSLMQNIELADTVVIAKSDFDSCFCDQPILGNNIAVTAWRLLKQQYHLSGGLSITITKKIPVAAGLGGGSADAAAVLLGVNKLYDLGLSTEQLQQIGLNLGADLPFFVTGGLALAEGIGERIQVLEPVPCCHLLLINIGRPLSTAAVYRRFNIANAGLHTDLPALLQALSKGDIDAVAGARHNALENPACLIEPAIYTLMQRIRAWGLYPMMSGSGPTVFVPANDCEQLIAVSKRLAKEYPFVTLTTTKL